jgi:hypothetical protein
MFARPAFFAEMGAPGLVPELCRQDLCSTELLDLNSMIVGK